MTGTSLEKMVSDSVGASEQDNLLGFREELGQIVTRLIEIENTECRRIAALRFASWFWPETVIPPSPELIPLSEVIIQEIYALVWQYSNVEIAALRTEADKLLREMSSKGLGRILQKELVRVISQAILTLEV